MFEIAAQEIEPEFERCWSAAGRQLTLAARAIDAPLRWLRSRLDAPMLEHLSFVLGNQLFFVRVEDVAGRVEGPGSLEGMLRLARRGGGHACRMPMRQAGVDWEPAAPGWGLVEAESGRSIDPPSMVTDQPVEMTDWELHDFAVQIVRNVLEDEGVNRISSQGHPDVDPSLWFTRDRGPEWVLVRAVRYPAHDAPLPDDWRTIAERCAHLGQHGHFASVAVANGAQPEQPDGEPPLRLLRGGPLVVRYTGMVALG